VTPEQKIKHMVLAVTADWAGEDAPAFEAEIVDTLWERLVENDSHWDGMGEVRGGEAETGLPCEWSRHYESKAVAAQAADGSWVGWTYWYGGGKHGLPEEVDWMDSAYDLTCVEEEKVVTVRTFALSPPTGSADNRPDAENVK